MTTPDHDPFLGGDSLPALKFEAVGTSHTFQIVDMRQVADTEIDGTPRHWPNGDPRQVWVLDVDTDGDGEDDHSLWCRGNMYTALRDAIKTAGIGTLGAAVKLTHHEVGKPRAPGFSGAKLYQAVAKAGPPLKPKADVFTDDDQW